MQQRRQSGAQAGPSNRQPVGAGAQGGGGFAYEHMMYFWNDRMTEMERASVARFMFDYFNLDPTDASSVDKLEKELLSHPQLKSCSELCGDCKSCLFATAHQATAGDDTRVYCDPCRDKCPAADAVRKIRVIPDDVVYAFMEGMRRNRELAADPKRYGITTEFSYDIDQVPTTSQPEALTFLCDKNYITTDELGQQLACFKVDELKKVLEGFKEMLTGTTNASTRRKIDNVKAKANSSDMVQLIMQLLTAKKDVGLYAQPNVLVNSTAEATSDVYKFTKWFRANNWGFRDGNDYMDSITTIERSTLLFIGLVKRFTAWHCDRIPARNVAFALLTVSVCVSVSLCLEWQLCD